MTRVLAPPPRLPVSRASRPSFSVLIPAYNAAATIADAVESILTQTLAPREVIVCDDGSTDDLGRALRPFGARLRLIRKRHGGVSSARNAAAREASADFLALLDADDVYLPTRLEVLAELGAERPDLDILTTDAVYEVDGQPAGRFNGPANPFETAAQREAILERCFIIVPAVRRLRVLELGGWDESLAIGEDWDCWMRLIIGGSGAASVDEPLLRYRLHDASLSARRVESLRARVTILERAAALEGLTATERARLAASLARHRRTALLAEAQRAMRSREPGARASALAVARDPEFGRRTRLRALFLAHVPPPLRSRLVPLAGFGTRSERREVTEDAG